MNIGQILKRKGTSVHEIGSLTNMDTPVKEVNDMGKTQVAQVTQVTQADVNEMVGKAISKLASVAETQANDIADIKSLVEQLGTRETAVVEVESAGSPTDTDTQVHETDDVDKRNMREGEMTFGVTRIDMSIRGIDFPKGSNVTAYEDSAGKVYHRVWLDGTSRLLARKFWENKGTVAPVRHPASQVKREANASAHKAQVKAITEYQGEAITYARGSKVTTTKNGRFQAHSPDSDKPTFVKNAQVKNGKLVENVTRMYFEDGLTDKVKRHNSGSCTCKPAWPCPAVQILGPNPVQVGEHVYPGPGDFLPENIANVNLESTSAKKFLCENLGVWGLDS